MKKNFLMFVFATCLILQCSLLLSACGKTDLIYFETIMPSEYEIEIEYTSEKNNFTTRYVKKGNEYYGKKVMTGTTTFYVDYYVLTNRTEKPYNYYAYNYVYEKWNAVKNIEKLDGSLFGGTEYPSFNDSFTFGTLQDIIDTNKNPFEQSEFVEECVVAGRPCVKYQITASDGSKMIYSYDKETSAIFEEIYVDNDGDTRNQSFTIKVTKFSTTVADNWKDSLSPALPSV